MEPLSKEKVTWRRRRLFEPPLSVLPLVFLLSGCVTLDALHVGEERAPTGAACHAVATWKNQVHFTPDPTRGGAPGPGLVGRFYLFDKTVGYPIAGNGSLVVDLYDCTNTAPGQQPVLIEEWRIDKDTLARLLVKDGIGWGYTLFLPWATYRPELRSIQLRVRYQPEGMPPLYAGISQVMLQDENQPPPTVMAKTVQPARPAAGATSSTAQVTAPPAGVNPVPAANTRSVGPPPSQSFNLARAPADAPR
jgi:hypothetical protein